MPSITWVAGRPHRQDLAVAAVGAPASFAQEDPYSGEGYGGTMDGGSPLSHSATAAANQASMRDGAPDGLQPEGIAVGRVGWQPPPG